MSSTPPPPPFGSDPQPFVPPQAPAPPPPAYGAVYGSPYGGLPAYDPQPQGSPQQAIVAFVFALLVCIPFGWLASAVLAVISMVKGRGKTNTGRGLAIAALVIDAVVLVAYVLAVATGVLNELGNDSIGSSADRTGSVALADLAAGDCFDDADLMGVEDDEEVTAPEDLTLVPCSEQHDFEVFLTFDFPQSGDYPGDDELSETALGRCKDGARDYVTTRVPKDLSLYFYAPSADTWKLGGDRTVACLAGRPGKKLSSTLHDE